MGHSLINNELFASGYFKEGVLVDFRPVQHLCGIGSLMGISKDSRYAIEHDKTVVLSERNNGNNIASRSVKIYTDGTIYIGFW